MPKKKAKVTRRMRREVADIETAFKNFGYVPARFGIVRRTSPQVKRLLAIAGETQKPVK